MTFNVNSNLIPYSNPNLGFTLEYPSNWNAKQESLVFISPQGGIGNQAPELITIDTEVLPTLDFSLDTYTNLSLRQAQESLQDFKLLNSSSTTLAGLPAHMIVFSFTESQNTTLQNLATWTIKDGMVYKVTYIATPEEFESSLPALQSVLDALLEEESMFR